jgi:hypothetical protein
MADKPDHSVVPAGDEPLFPTTDQAAQPSVAKPSVAPPGDSDSLFPAQPSAQPTAQPTNAPAASAGGAYPGGNWNPANWVTSGGDLLPQQGPTLGPEKTLAQNLAIVGQGGTDIAHGIYNYERSAANYATGGGADWALGKLNQVLPAGTPAALRPNPYDWQQAQTQQARTEMGPGMDTLAMLTGLRGFNRVAGPLAGRAAGESIVNPALQGGVYVGGKSFFEGDDPKTIALKTAGGTVAGGGLGLVANKIVSPAVQALVTKFYGGSTPEELAAKLDQTASSAEQQAASQAEAAKAAAAAKTAAAQQQATSQQAEADQTLSNLRFNRKDLGFEVGTGNKNPTYGDLQAQLENMKNMKPEDDPGGVVPILQQRIQTAFQGPEAAEAQAAHAAASARISGQATAAQQQAEQEAAAATAQAQDPAIAARTKADQAQWLASAGRTAGLPGANVPAQATQLLNQPNLTPEQIKAYSDIASAGVQGKGPSLWESLGRIAGGSAGAGAAQMVGMPELAPYAMLAIQEAGRDLGSRIAGPSGEAALRQAIARGWPALTGEWPASARGQLSASDAVKFLYGLR